MAKCMKKARYDRVVEALASLDRCVFTGRIDTDLIKTILGEAGDIWPGTIEADVVAANGAG